MTVMATIYGLDVLGLAKFGAAKQAIPQGFAIGVFSRTFGDSMPDVIDLVAKGKCKALRVHLLWSDNEHTYGEKDIPELKKEAKRWNDFAAKHTGVPVFLSPFCEHNLPNPDPYLKIVADTAPLCTPVNSVYNGGLSGKYLNEVHGVHAKPLNRDYIFSYDGSDICDSDIPTLKEKHARAWFWFAWTANFNGRKEVNDKTDRGKRRDWPSEKLIASIVYSVDNSKIGGHLPPRWYWRSHSEDSGNRDAGTDKPVLVTNKNFDSVDLMKGTKVIDSAKRHPIPSGDGRFRYHFSLWGYELARKGGGVLEVRAGGKIHGSVNPAFCEGNVPAY